MANSWPEDPYPHQQAYYEMLPYLDRYEPYTNTGLEILRRKVGYAMFGPPDEEPQLSNGNTGYSEQRFKVVETVAACLIEVNRKKTFGNRHQLDMAIVFVFVGHREHLLQYPVFRVEMSASDFNFVDNNCRVYPTWRNYLETNVLPPGRCCWPLDGIYCGNDEGNVKVEFGMTPAAAPENQLLQTADQVSTVSTIGTAGVFVAAMLAPVAAPVLAVAGTCAAASGVYSAVRSGWALFDRSQHQQTINPLQDRQAASSWLSVAGSTTGLAAGMMVNRAATLATEGLVMGAAEQLTLNALNVTSLAVNATGVGFGAFMVSERYREGDLTTLDVFQFASSVLFFTHATLSFQTASSIIQEAQQGMLQDFQQTLRSNRHRKEFKKLAKETVTGSETVTDGNAKVIRSIRNIDNKDDFFAGMIRTRKDLRDHKVTFSENGKIIVNGGAEIHPMNLYNLGRQQRQEFLSMAGGAVRGSAPEATFMSRLQSAARTSTWSSSDGPATGTSDSTVALSALTAQLQHLFPDSRIGATEVTLTVMVTDELTTRVCTGNDRNQARWWRLVWKHVINLVTNMLLTYEECKRVVKEVGAFLDEPTFNLEQGIRVTNIFVHYVINTFERYSDCIQDLIRDITDGESSDD